jgi:hypothetical protein
MKSNNLVSQCLALLKRDDVKNELKNIYKPFIEGILYGLNPYIYIIIFLAFSIFILLFIILILLIFQKNSFINPISVWEIPNIFRK